MHFKMAKEQWASTGTIGNRKKSFRYTVEYKAQ